MHKSKSKEGEAEYAEKRETQQDRVVCLAILLSASDVDHFFTPERGTEEGHFLLKMGPSTQ